MDKRTSERTKLRYSLKDRIDSLIRYMEKGKYLYELISNLIGIFDGFIRSQKISRSFRYTYNKSMKDRRKMVEARNSDIINNKDVFLSFQMTKKGIRRKSSSSL